ncbi:TonB-dependent receptor [Haliea sp. E17]|uniref:TonB-dependent receptor n=1 Tax=Haliea sp. E17 TaxID=3401576 RepID=UPI003AAE5151
MLSFSRHTFRRVVTFSALATVLASGAQAARLDGRVTDASGTRFLGAAIVRIPELKLTTSTGRDGRFSFPNLPEGNWTVEVEYVGAEKVSQTVVVGADDVVQNVRVGKDLPPLENVLVYGASAQNASAINQQRASRNIASVITADEAGALPDENIAEALQRVPGVFIERDQGEGRFVGIRGLQPSLNTVKINGVNIAAPDSDQRATALDVVPSGLLENLKVSKSFTPDMDGDAIGGTIEVKSLSGFDRDGQYFEVTAEGGYNDLMEEWSPQGTATWSNVFDAGAPESLAVALSVSYQDREFGSENLEQDGGWTPAEANGLLYPEQLELRDYQISRQRMGAVFNLDWRPSAGDEYYLRTLYSDFEDKEIRNRIEIEPDEDSGQVSAGGGQFDAAEYARSLKDRKETQDIISAVIGGLNQRGDWTFEYSLGYSYAEEDEPGRHDSKFEGADDYAFAYTSLGETPKVVLDPMAYFPQNFILDDITVENNLVEDEEWSATFDIARQFDLWGSSTEIKGGAKVRLRDKTRKSTIDVFDSFDDVDALKFRGVNPDFDLADFGFGLSRSALRSFTRGLTDDNRNADESLTESTVGDYDIQEDIYAGYLMATMDFDTVTLIGGVRYELTEFESEGATGTVYENNTLDFEETGFGTSRQDGDYDYFLPSLTVRWDVSDQIVARAAASQTIARPSFGALNPSSLAEIEEDDGETELQLEDLGNPELDPYESINLDLGGEYYPEANIGMFSLGVFYKNLDNYIAQANVAGSIDLTPWTSLVGLSPADIDDADVLQYINGDSAEVRGVEIAWFKQFDNGFMLGINGTLIDSYAEFDGRDVDLPGSYGEVGNLMVGYENYGLQLRLAVNYQSEALAVVGGDKSEDVYQDDHTQLDASVKYNIMDGLQVYFEGVNLTDEPRYFYQDDQAYNWQYEEYGRTYVVGLRMSAF